MPFSKGSDDLVGKYGEFDRSQFTDLELRMYVLIQNGMASMMELEEYYTLDEALKLYALMVMRQDTEHGMLEDSKHSG